MRKVIDKELLSYMLMLEESQQEKVLSYIKGLLSSDELNSRAAASEQAIQEGHVKPYSAFNEDFENWKKEKRKPTK